MICADPDGRHRIEGTICINAKKQYNLDDVLVHVVDLRKECDACAMDKTARNRKQGAMCRTSDQISRSGEREMHGFACNLMSKHQRKTRTQRSISRSNASVNKASFTVTRGELRGRDMEKKAMLVGDENKIKQDREGKRKEKSL